MLRFQLDTTGNLLKDLIAFWPLDEPGGQRRDMLGYNPLTDNATVTSAKGIGGQGTAAKFTSANSEYLNVSDNPQLSTGNIDFTIAAWIYLDSTTADVYVFVSRWKSLSKEYVIRYGGTANRLQFQVSPGADDNGTVLSADNLGVPTTGRWYCIVAWHDAAADTINIQVDNGAIDSAAFTTGLTDGTADFVIGSLDPGFNAQYVDGRIAYVGFWKRVLSQQERTDLYNFGRGNRLITY